MNPKGGQPSLELELLPFPVLAHTKLRKQLTTKVSVLVDRVLPETKEKILFAVGRQES